MIARCRALLPALLVLLLMAPTAALAQPKRTITGEGTEGFRALLRAKGLQPLEKITDLGTVEAKRVVIVSFRGADQKTGEPAPDLLDDFQVDWKKFVAAGGALFVATDQRIEGDWKRAFGADINTEDGVARIVYAANPPSYRALPHCPYVMGVPKAVPALFEKTNSENGGRANVSSLTPATNKPACLRPSAELELLGIFYGDWAFEQHGPFSRAHLPFAQGRRYDPEGGKFLILSDHSVFINSMLLPRNAPNDNLVFASNCVDWLIRGKDANRTYVLFMEDGKIWQKDDYNLILQSMPQPNPEDVAQFLWENRDLLWKNTDLAEEVLSNLEESGILEEVEKSGVIGDLLDDHLDTWMTARLVLVAGALFLLAYATMSFMGSRYKFPKRVPRLSYLLDRMRPRSGLLDLRLRSGLGRGQYYELARQRAREVFAELKLTPAEEGPLPTVEIDAGWWQRGRILRELQQIWRVAYGTTPVAITGKQWEPWMKKLTRIEKMLRTGAIRFQ